MVSSRKRLVLFFFSIFLVSLTFLISLTLAHRQSAAQVVWSNTHYSSLATLLDPAGRDLHFDIGNYYFTGEHYDLGKATRHFKIAIESDNQFLEPHYQLGRIYFLQGQFGKALIEITEVLRIDPEFKKGYYMLGLIGGYAGDDLQAIYGFSEYVRRDPSNWAGYNDLGWIHFRRGDFIQANAVVERGLEQSRANPWLLNLHGAILISLGEKERARESLNQAKEAVSRMRTEDWGRSYPGNDPTIYRRGLSEMHSTIDHNLSLLDTNTLPTSTSPGI